MARKKNHGPGRFLIGAAVVGVAAYGVYRVIKRRREILEADDAEYKASAPQKDPDRTDPEETEAAGTADEEDLEFGAEEDRAWEDDAGDSGIDDSRYASVNFRQAADRAYTTIQIGSQEALDRVMEAVGPKGSEVLATVGEAAGEVGRTVASSAAKIIDILAEPETSGMGNIEVPEEGDAVWEEASCAAVAEPEETAVFVDETGEEESGTAGEQAEHAEAASCDAEVEDSVQEQPAETVADQETVVTEQFLDDGAEGTICVEPIPAPVADPVEDFFDESDAL